MNAIDTNVLAYSVDTDAGDKRLQALAILAELDPERTLIPWQVICELGSVLNKLIRRGRMPDDPATLVSALTSRYRLAMPSRGLVIEGLRLQMTHQLSYWDALLLAACAEAGVTRLYSEDIQSRPEIEGITLVNPFAAAS